MQIVSGIYKGTRLRVPSRASFRPTQQKVREAVFSSLGDLGGLHFTDLYAGSGAMGLEALSRGALSVTFVEKDRHVFELLTGNIKACKDARYACHPVKADVARYLSRAAEPADVIFMDPPYVKKGDSRATLNTLMQAVYESGLAAKSSLVVFEMFAGNADTVTFSGWQMLQQRRYGDALTAYYRKE